mgnify:FL=1|tara:strand:- start:1303 stop:1632 length:330 start_codon:yes stop_codon:yes gene_type:complete
MVNHFLLIKLLTLRIKSVYAAASQQKECKMVIVIYTDETAEECTFWDVDSAIGYLVEAGYEDQTAAVIDYNIVGKPATTYADVKLERLFKECESNAEADRLHNLTLVAS